MQQAIIQYRSIIKKVANLHIPPVSTNTGFEPITTKCRDAALHLFSRRPDLAMGAVVNGTPDGGLSIDIIRRQHDYLIRISGRGDLSLVSSRTGMDPDKESIYSKTVNESVFLKLEMILEDPIKDMSFMMISDDLPVAANVLKTFDQGELSGMSLLSTRLGLFVSEPLSCSRFGFDRIAYSIPTGDESDIRHALSKYFDVSPTSWPAKCIMLSRNVGAPHVASLHPPDSLSLSHIQKLKLKSGFSLLDHYNSTQVQELCEITRID